MNFRETPIFNRNYAVLTVAYCGFLFFLSAQSTFPLPRIFSWQDLIGHAGAYFVLGLLARKSAPEVSYWVIISFIVLYGLSDEIHQYFVPGRFCDILDFAADATGGTIALIIHRHLMLKRRTGIANERGVP
ncbi:MAG: VanZ family protein [Holophagae bacterium]|nr:VanZ family protein [Holophagae bacterium]